MTTQPLFQTPYAQEREQKEIALYNDYVAMNSVEGQSKIAVNDYLMRKYGIHSMSTVYTIVKRVEARLAKRTKQTQL